MSTALLRQVLGAIDPSLSDTERAARARLVGEAAADLGDLVRVADAVLPASALDAIRTDKGDQDATERYLARHRLGQLRAAVADASGALGRPLLTGDGTTGIGAGLPLVREIATPIADTLAAGTTSQAPAVPAIATGDVDGMIDPPQTITETDRIVIGLAAGDRWHHGAVVAEFARQVWEWTTDAGRAILDQTLLDIADRAAERGMGQLLEAAAGGTRAAGSDLGAALDDAESTAGAAGSGACQLALVSPADWPAVRRAVAQTWSQQPSPRVVVSCGATAGTVTLLGPSAAHLFVQDYVTDGSVKAARMELAGFVLRPFYVGPRNADAIQTVTL